MKGELLKALREEQNYTQPELASLLHISPSSVAMYETNKREPSDKLKIELANFFNVSVDYLIGKSDKRLDESVKSFVEAMDAVDNSYGKLLSEDVPFYEGYKNLNEKNKQILKDTLEVFLRSQGGK